MINLKFYMYFNSERIRTLDDLREHFIAEDVMEAYENGQLTKWLRAWRHKEELEQVEAITSTNAREILAELMKIFDPNIRTEEIDAALSMHDYVEERRKYREHMMTHGLDELETLRRERGEIAALRRELDTAIRERDGLRNELKTCQRELDILKRELDVAKRERDSAIRERDSAKQALEEAQRTKKHKTVESAEKRIEVSSSEPSFEWIEKFPRGKTYVITNAGNSTSGLIVAGGKNISQAHEIADACLNGTRFDGLFVYRYYGEDLYFYVQEV